MISIFHIDTSDFFHGYYDIDLIRKFFIIIRIIVNSLGISCKYENIPEEYHAVLKAQVTSAIKMVDVKWVFDTLIRYFYEIDSFWKRFGLTEKRVDRYVYISIILKIGYHLYICTNNYDWNPLTLDKYRSLHPLTPHLDDNLGNRHLSGAFSMHYRAFAYFRQRFPFSHRNLLKPQHSNNDHKTHTHVHCAIALTTLRFSRLWMIWVLKMRHDMVSRSWLLFFIVLWEIQLCSAVFRCCQNSVCDKVKHDIHFPCNP